MNRLDKEPPLPGQALLHFTDSDYQVVRPGTFVLCAVTGQRIALEDLRYWSAARQEAYASAEVATRRFEDLRQRGRA